MQIHKEDSNSGEQAFIHCLCGVEMNADTRRTNYLKNIDNSFDMIRLVVVRETSINSMASLKESAAC